jgi:hypothetical protein
MICTSENGVTAATFVNWNGGVFNKKCAAPGASNKAKLMRFHDRDIAPLTLGEGRGTAAELHQP